MKETKEIIGYRKNGNKIVVLISIDELFSNWKEACKVELLSNLDNNYLLKDFNTSKLKYKYNLETIPRYILINKKVRLLILTLPDQATQNLKFC